MTMLRGGQGPTSHTLLQDAEEAVDVISLNSPSIQSNPFNLNENENDSFLPKTSSLPPTVSSSPSGPLESSLILRFIFSFVGLQLSYLTWGYMQEAIMTTVFTPTPSSPKGLFPSAAFCVFSNRFLAVIVAAIAVKLKHGEMLPAKSPPLVAFGPCAFSNTCSSWAQYASLTYVTFPVQTLFKSSKVIPVMLMGRLLKNTNYPLSEYFEAGLITLGVFIFSYFSRNNGGDAEPTSMTGIVFLVVYIFADSFTSQWQSKIYSQYGKKNVDQYQMMLGVNCFAIIFTLVGLIASGDIPIVLEFMAINPVAIQYNVITAITSASGQLFIFYTIKEFGPIVFTIIMTTRQMFSICISTIMFGHVVTSKSLVGAAIVFGVIFWQIFRKLRVGWKGIPS